MMLNKFSFSFIIAWCKHQFLLAIAQCKFALSEDMKSPVTWIHCVDDIELVNLKHLQMKNKHK